MLDRSAGSSPPRLRNSQCTGYNVISWIPHMFPSCSRLENGCNLILRFTLLPKFSVPRRLIITNVKKTSRKNNVWINPWIMYDAVCRAHWREVQKLRSNMVRVREDKKVVIVAQPQSNRLASCSSHPKVPSDFLALSFDDPFIYWTRGVRKKR